MSREPNTRASLLSRMRDPENGDAWREFDSIYRGLILSYCQRRNLQHWDAEDVRQMVMLSLARIFQGGFRYRPDSGQFRRYFGVVVRNAINSLKSRPKSQPDVIDSDELVALAPSESEHPDDVWNEEWRQHHLRLAMNRLRNESKAQHIAIFEDLLDGQSVREVAGTHDVSEAAVHKVKQRMRDRLRNLIDEQIREEDEF